MTMNTKAIYGVVQDVDKPTYYTGLETDTATVNVDNDRREISVDVHLSDFTGTGEGQAYPGPLGALVAANLSNEVERATTREQELQEDITELYRQDNETLSEIQRVEDKIPTKVIQLEDNANYVTTDTLQNDYASKTYVQESINNAKFELEGFVDFSSYVLKQDYEETVQALTDADAAIYDAIDAKEEEILNKIPEQVDLTPYPTKEEIAESIYTKEEIETKLDELDITDQLKNYYTISQTEEAIQNALSHIDRIVCGSAAELLENFIS